MLTQRKIILDFIGNNRGLVLVALLAALFSNFLNVLLPLSIGKFYEIVLHDGGSVKGKMFAMLPFEIRDVTGFFIFFGSVIVMKGVMTFFEKFLSSMVSERVARDMRELAFASQLTHSMASHQTRSVGKYLVRYGGDLRTIQNFISKGMLGFAGDVFFITVAIAVLWLMQPQLTAIFLVVLILSGCIVLLLGKKLQTASQERRTQRTRTLDFVSSRLQAFYTIKSFNRETLENKSFRRKSSKQYQAGVSYYKFSALIQSLLPVFFFGILALMLFMVARNPDQSAGNIFVFILLFLYMQSVIKRLLRVNITWQEGRMSMKKLFDLMDLPSEPRTESAALAEIKGNLIFRNVSFAFENNKQVLKNISFEILPESITLIKGRQGSGKSTLLKLIQKIFEPHEGEILLDKHNYNQLSAFEIRREVTIVSAETPLLGSTVFKAIVYKDEDEKREEVSRLLEQLEIKLGDTADETLDFKLDEHAKNLSAGQRILLQFARALLTRKKILLLDEPFQHLDEESKSKVIEKLNKLKSRRTIILISDNVPPELAINQIIQI